MDYSWNHVRKLGGSGYEYFDIYDVDCGSLNGGNGELPQPEYEAEAVEQRQICVYVQNQILFYDRVSVLLGARRDGVWSRSFGGAKVDWSAATSRAARWCAASHPS
jgi:iron complex outermembrane receptor protein